MTDHRPSPVPVLKDLLWSSTPRKLVTIVIIGLFIRYFVGLFFTYPTDINYWVLVTENYISGADMFSLPGYYYTPVWGYFLSVISAIAGFTGIPLGEYVPDLVAGSMAMDWKITLPSLSYALLVKSFLFLFDVLAAIVLYRIGRVVFDEKRAILMFAVWFLCPFTIIISSIRIMFKNLEILFMLLSLLMMLKRRPAWAGVMMGLSLMTKPYGMFLAILMMGYSYAQARSVKYTVTYVVTTLVAGLSVMIPILLSGQLDESLIWLTSRAGSGGSGYSVSLYLMPSLVVIAVVISFLMAFFRKDSFDLLVGAGMILAAGMLIIPGNIQYYLLLLPFLLMVRSRWVYPAMFMFMCISVCSFISFSTWSSVLYVNTGYWGSGVLDIFTDILWPIDSTIAYDDLKTVTALAVILAPVATYLRGVAND